MARWVPTSIDGHVRPGAYHTITFRAFPSSKTRRVSSQVRVLRAAECPAPESGVIKIGDGYAERDMSLCPGLVKFASNLPSGSEGVASRSAGD